MDLKTLSFDNSFFQEETRWDYSISTEMKKVWACELDMLQKLLNVCKKHNLKVYAGGGTLLGVIRHKGFIPWDDDIDVEMPREDYEKLCYIAKEEFTEPYFFQTCKTDSWHMGFAKIRNNSTTGVLSKKEPGKTITYNQGIWIDIFPQDRITTKPFLQFLTRARISLCFKSRNILFSKMNELSFGKKCWRILLRIFGFTEKKLNLLGIKLAKKSNAKNPSTETSYIGYLSFLLRKSMMKPENSISKLTEMPFENISIPVPEGYDEILRRQYGDYETPVKGNALHQGSFFDTELPWIEYQKKQGVRK